jgi:hypothetical protein
MPTLFGPSQAIHLDAINVERRIHMLRACGFVGVCCLQSVPIVGAPSSAEQLEPCGNADRGQTIEHPANFYWK